MISLMGNKVEITLDEFKEYMQLKSQMHILNEKFDKMHFLSGLSLAELYELDVIGYSLDDTDKRNQKINFTFEKRKKGYPKYD